MGGKGGYPEPPATTAYPAVDQTAEMEQMMAMMQAMQMAQMSMPATPATPALPSVFRDPEINWSEKNKQLASKMRADYNVDRARRRSSASTVLTSPLLGDEEPAVTKSLLTGG